MNDTFSEADLEPNDEDRKRAQRQRIDRTVAAVGAIAGAFVAGGIVALGAAAAPAVFELAPAPFSGYAMGAAFARFDRIAIGGSALLLLCEVIRTFMWRRSRQRPLVRIRRLSAMLLAGLTTLMGLSFSPGIRALHEGGARRGVGETGQQLETLHRQAEVVGKIEVVLALLAAGLHVVTVRRTEDDDQDELDQMVAPGAPGPS